MAEKAAAIVGCRTEVWLVEAVLIFFGRSSRAGLLAACGEADASMIAQTHVSE